MLTVKYFTGYYDSSNTQTGENMKNLISNIVVFIIAISILALIFGSIGADDLEGVQEYENYSCEMINSGAWGASKERKAECKVYKGQ